MKSFDELKFQDKIYCPETGETMEYMGNFLAIEDSLFDINQFDPEDWEKV